MDAAKPCSPSAESSRSVESLDGSDVLPQEMPADQDSYSDTDVPAELPETPRLARESKEVQDGDIEEILRKKIERLRISREALHRTNRVLQVENSTLSKEHKSLQKRHKELSEAKESFESANRTLSEENEDLRSRSEALSKEKQKSDEEVERFRVAESEHVKAQAQLQRFYTCQKEDYKKLEERYAELDSRSLRDMAALLQENQSLHTCLASQWRLTEARSRECDELRGELGYICYAQSSLHCAATTGTNEEGDILSHWRVAK